MQHTSCEVRDGRRDAVVDHQTFTPLVRPEKGACAQERTNKSWLHSAVQASSYAFLAPYGVVCVAHGSVLRRHVRVTLLSRLDGIQRVHQHVPRGAAYPAGQYCLQHSVN